MWSESLAWRIEMSDGAKTGLAQLDKPTAQRIISFLRERVAALDNPRSIGEALQGSRLGHLWRYRIGDYRVICDLQDGRLCVLVLKIGNRRDVYRA